MIYQLKAVHIIYVAVISGLLIDVLSIPLPDESERSEDDFGDIVAAVNLTLTDDPFHPYHMVEIASPRPSREVECCGKNKRSSCEDDDETSSAECCYAEDEEGCDETSNDNIDSDRDTREAEETKSCCGSENNESCCGAEKVARSRIPKYIVPKDRHLDCYSWLCPGYLPPIWKNGCFLLLKTPSMSSRLTEEDSKCCGSEETPVSSSPSAIVERDASIDQSSEVPPSP